jgi:hypothetical protein
VSDSGVVHGFVDGAEAWTADVGQAERVRVGPAGDAVVGTCCEPAAGRVATIAADGSIISESATVGVYPTVSVDGSLVATVHQPAGLIVTLVGDNTDVLNLPPYPDELIADIDPIGLSDLALSLDSTTLAFTYDTGSRPPILLTLGVDAASLGDATQVPGPDDHVAWVLPAFTSQGLAVVGVEVTPPHELSGPAQIALVDPNDGTVVRELAATTSPVVDLDSDPTGTWLIYVLDDGSVHYVGLDGEGDTLATEGFSSASW